MLNVAVGAGKSSLVRDVVAWAVSGGGSCDPAYGRSLRVLVGHAVYTLAEENVDVLRETFDSEVPYFDHKKKLSAPHSLSEIYGRYHPTSDDGGKAWRQNKFKVASVEDAPTFNKEPTVQAISYGSTFIGERGDLIILDDIVSQKNVGDPEFLAWMESVEDRLEPGGLIVMLGQRVGVTDGYQQVLERTYDPENGGDPVPLYVQIAWPAHNTQTCDGNHRQWDLESAGCLLDEKRLPWAKLRREADKPSFGSSYQQDPTQGGDGLIPKLWIDGGKDADGVEYPGCLDRERRLGEMPVLSRSEAEDLIVYASVDPALSSGYWSVQVWGITKWNGPRYLIDGHRVQMRMADFVGITGDSLTGLMLQLQVESRQRDREHPIRVWIIEENLVRGQLADTFAFQSFRRAHPDTEVIWHRTDRNKQSKEFGVEALLPQLYRWAMYACRGLELIATSFVNSCWS
jgi:hypothetical protein